MNQQQQSQSMSSVSKSQSTRKGQSVLNQFDLTPIKEIDPFQTNGFKERQNIRLPFLIRFLEKESEEQMTATIEYVNVRLLSKKENNKIEKFTIEVTSDNDLFFYYFHTIDIESYEALKQTQLLDGGFQQYFISTQQYLEKCKTEPQKYACILNIRSDTSSFLQVIQTLNYKDVEILRYEMLMGDDDIIRQHVSYKYGCKRSLLNMMDGRIKDVNELVKLKNPQLLLHIQKILAGATSSSQQTGIFSSTQSANKQNISQIYGSNFIENTQIKQ